MVKNIRTVAGIAVAALFFGSAQAFAEEETPEPPVTDITINIVDMAPLEIQLIPERLAVGVGDFPEAPPFNRPFEVETANDEEVIEVEGVSASRQGLSMAVDMGVGSGPSSVSLRFGLNVRTHSSQNSDITGSFSGIQLTPEGSDESSLLDGDSIGLLNDLSLRGLVGVRPGSDADATAPILGPDGCGPPFTVGSASANPGPVNFPTCSGLKPGFNSIDGDDTSPLVVVTSMTVANDGNAPTEPGTVAASFTWIIEAADQPVD